jgi:hypothetical protein
MKLRQESLRNMHKILEAGDMATTPELAERFGCNIQDMLHRLQRYAKHGYLVRGESKEVCIDKRGRAVKRRIYNWTPTDKLRELVRDNPAAQTVRYRPVANSIWQWGQV